MYFEDEIKEYEKELKNSRYKKDIKDLKKEKFKLKLSKLLVACYPYVISTGLITIFSLSFIKKCGIKNNLITKQTNDSFGNEKSISEYSNENIKGKGIISHITSWKLNENNEYERTIKKYDSNNLNPEIIKRLIVKDETIDSLDEMFGNPLSVEREVGNTLTDEEINMPDHIEAITYIEDKNDYIVTKFSAGDITLASLLAFILMIGVNQTIYKIRFYNYNFSPDKENKLIDELYRDKLKELYFKQEDTKAKKLKK